MNKKEPWELYAEIWPSQSSFFSYLRGGLRLIWSRFPAKLQWKKVMLVDPPKDYTGRAKKLGKCHYCKKMFAASHLEVDHKEQAGKCDSWETSPEFLYKLLDCNDNWVLACRPCHKIKSHAERKGISFEQASVDKKVIAFMKLPKADQLAYFQEFGYNDDIVGTIPKRKKLIEKILQEKLT